MRSNPSVNTEAGTVRYSAASDDRFDAPSPDQAAVLVVVIAAVAEEDVRPSTWSSDESRDISWVTSLRFPPVRGTASGMP